MSAVPAPGYPLYEVGARVYQAVYDQAAPSGRSGVWWLNWFSQLHLVPAFKTWASAARARNRHDILLVGVEALQAWGERIANIERVTPGSATPSSEIPFTGLVTTSQGWSLFKGTHDIPVADDVWSRILKTQFDWAAREVVRGTFSSRSIDVILAEMVLPDAGARRLPVFRPPQTLAGNTLALEGWYLWKRSTGGNEAMAIYSQSSAQRWVEQNEQYARLDNLLGGAERILRYASLQEPLLRLQERLEEFDNKRVIAHTGYRVFLQNRSEASGAFTPAELLEIESDMRQLRQVEGDTMRGLPPGVFDGRAPAGLGGFIVVGLVLGTVAIGLLAAVAAAIKQLDHLIARQRAMGVQTRTEAELQRQAAAIARQHQEALLAANSIQDPAKRAAAVKEANQALARAMAVNLQARQDVAQAAAAIATNSPLAAKKGGEQTWIAVLGGLGLLAWWGWGRSSTAG